MKDETISSITQRKSGFFGDKSNLTPSLSSAPPSEKTQTLTGSLNNILYNIEALKRISTRMAVRVFVSLISFPRLQALLIDQFIPDHVPFRMKHERQSRKSDSLDQNRIVDDHEGRMDSPQIS